MDRGVVPEVEEIPDSNNGACADHEAPAPDARAQQIREMWVVDINNRLEERLLDAVQHEKPQTVDKNAPFRNPSICWTGNPPEKFYIGYLLHHGCRPWAGEQGHSNMWEYAAYMARSFDLDVNVCLEFMETNDKLVRSYYDNEYQTGFVKESKQFQESLLVAGCFLCFAIIMLNPDILESEFFDWNTMDSVDSMMFNRLSLKICKEATRTKLDMLNEINQIPWMIVEVVFTRSKFSKLCNTSIERLAIIAFENLYPRADKYKVNGATSFPQEGFRHLLHLFHWTRVPALKWCQVNYRGPFKGLSEFYIPNANELLGSTSTFKKLDGSFCDVVYSEKGMSALMEIAPLHIFPYSRELYTNLLDFEQSAWECEFGYAFTSHIACMNSLLQTKEDVKVLQESGIVKNILHVQKDVLNFVHDMGKFLMEDTDCIIPEDLDILSKKVIKHHERRASRAYTEFTNQFCPNRWVIFSIMAAFILFVLTFIQTIYTGLGYYKT